jgi:tetratricopeptide (TPR) repeat protein
MLGEVELRNQDLAEAAGAFQKAIDLDKSNVTAVVLLAKMEEARGSVDQAIDHYSRALGISPRDVQIRVSLGELLERQGQWQRAEGYYQQALQVQPDYPLAANNLAYLMLEHGGNPNVALSLAQTARKGLPELANTADTLGWAYYKQGVYGAAIDQFQEAVKRDARNPVYHYHLGMAYEKENNHAMAKKQLESALEINPHFAQADEIRRLLSDSPQHN